MVMSGEARMPFQNPMGMMPRMVRFTSFLLVFYHSIQVFNTPQRPAMPMRPPTQLMANTGGMQQSMRFNLGTLPYTFMQMGPDGITLNQVSASVVADVQTSDSPTSSSQQPPSANRPTLRKLF